MTCADVSHNQGTGSYGGQASTYPAIPCPCLWSSGPWISGAACQPETSKYSASNKGNSWSWGLPALSLNHSVVFSKVGFVFKHPS